MTRVLVTGGGGQVALALVRQCPADVEVVALDRGKLDIVDEAAVMATLMALRPNAVINCAAYTAVDRAEDEPAKARAINEIGVGHLAAACAQAECRLIHLSTDFVFDGLASIPYRPDALTAPISTYGRTKRDGELRALAIDDALIVRTSWVYGADGTNFIKTMLHLLAEREQVSVVADQVGSPTHVRSLADAIWNLLAAGATGIHHHTDAGVCSWYDFACVIAEEAQRAGLIEHPANVMPISSDAFPQAARRPAFSVLDKTATWGILGRPSQHWQVELRSLLRQLKEPTH